MQKLKDARSEAAKEIEEYKAKKEAEYKKFETEVSTCVLKDGPGFNTILGEERMSVWKTGEDANSSLRDRIES